MSSRRTLALVALAGLAAGCRFAVVLGDASIDNPLAPVDAGPEAQDPLDALDAPERDAYEGGSDSGDAPLEAEARAPDAAPEPDTELTGLGSLAVALAPDDQSPADAYRVYYAGRDGALWLERRAVTDQALLCRVSLGHPPAPYSIVAGAPAAAAPGELVVVAASTALGGLRLFARQSTDTSGSLCGYTYAPWEPLPALEPDFVLASAPAAAQVLVDPPQSVVAARAASGAIVVSSRVEPNGAWAGWGAIPSLPAGESALSRPTLLGGLSYGVEMGLVVQTASGARSLREQFFYWQARTWLSSWVRVEPAAEAPATALSIEYINDGGNSPVWFAYGARSGHVWVTSRMPDGLKILNVWTDWSDLGAPLAGVVSPVVLAPLGTWRGARSSLFAQSAAPQGPRVLLRAERRSRVWSTPVAPWAVAGDELE